MAVQTKRGGLEVDGLAEAVRALKRVSPELRKEAIDIFRDEAKLVQRMAQARIGAGARTPSQKGMIGRSATGTGAAVKLRASKYPWALQNEYGQRVGHVWARPYGERAMKSRPSSPFKPPTSSDMGRNKGGYMIQPVIRQQIPFIAKRAGDRMLKLMDKALRRAGVPKGHGL